MSEFATRSAGTATEDVAAPRRTGRSVRGYLMILTAALVLPVLLFSAFVLWRFAAAERARIQSEAFEYAQTLSANLDREFAGIFASLDVLSTSGFVESGDYEGLHRQALELLRRQGIVAVLIDISGQQLMNARLPLGEPLPRSILPFEPEALASGRSFVTDYLVGQLSGRAQVLAAMPIRKDGQLAAVLYFGVPLERLAAVLRAAEIPPPYTAAITDRVGTILARSTRGDEFVGRLASPDMREAATGEGGTWEGTSVDGSPNFGAYRRSRLTGFRSATAIRFVDLNAPLWRSVTLFAALGAAVTALSVLLAVFIGQRLTLPIASLAREAARLGRGQPVSPLRTGMHEANAVGIVLADASARLREREGDLREATEEMARFAYIVSHDLRSPLVNIMGFTTELEALRVDLFERLAQLRAAARADESEADLALGRDFDEAIGFIKTSIGKMDRLINAILQLSRQGRRELLPERIDMKALFAGIKASLTVQAERAEATVTVANLPEIESDRLAMEQIFSNLVDNGLKYLRDGVPGRIEITGRIRGGTAVYDVRDNGRGVDAKDAERIFDLFRRSGVQDRPGEGIGLAHVRALVRLLGGSVGLTSEPGQGSTFTVTLPRRWVADRQRKAV